MNGIARLSAIGLLACGAAAFSVSSGIFRGDPQPPEMHSAQAPATLPAPSRQLRPLPAVEPVPSAPPRQPVLVGPLYAQPSPAITRAAHLAPLAGALMGADSANLGPTSTFSVIQVKTESGNVAKVDQLKCKSSSPIVTISGQVEPAKLAGNESYHVELRFDSKTLASGELTKDEPEWAVEDVQLTEATTVLQLLLAKKKRNSDPVDWDPEKSTQEKLTIYYAPPPEPPKITFIKRAKGDADTNAIPEDSSTKARLLNVNAFVVQGTAGELSGDHTIKIRTHRSPRIPKQKFYRDGSGPWKVEIEHLPDGEHHLEAIRWNPEENRERPVGDPSDPVKVRIRTTGPRVVAVTPVNFMFKEGPHSLMVQFHPANPPTPDSGGEKTNYDLMKVDSAGKVGSSVGNIFQGATWQASTSSAVLNFSRLEPGTYQLVVKKASIVDEYGNSLDSKNDYTTNIVKPMGGERIGATPGISGMTGPYVEFKEWTDPRDVPVGFNPSDHVETRVARLYYFRDAHRVAQIINRTARSYNRNAVDMAHQLADDARRLADDATDKRKASELRAIEAARQTREAERELAAAEQALAGAQRAGFGAEQDMARIQRDPSLNDNERAEEIENVTKVRDSALEVANQARGRVQSLRNTVETRRRDEVVAAQQVAELENTEQRAREDQFRREKAAGHADPDTYAPGKPGSDDPVRQVSVSVMGEGLIHLRGPIKGINIIRRMINQIDAPVGQVRVNVHTVQINGEHGDRMEKVADRIQKYIDHSRFLTTQSAELLRRAIVHVAATRAMEAFEADVVGSQQIRDRRYLYAFFGRDFIDELAAMDSEFLKTGNKLLSLHSMDSTSLASALFLMALAKNETRQEILHVFEQLTSCELVRMEQGYLQAGAYCSTKCSWDNLFCKEKFQLFSQNARFESLRGFFQQENFGHNDTMTPIQREFVRLAQIFKSRLITEMELKQRIMERAVIEERVGNYKDELQKARKKDQDAKDAVDLARSTLAENRTNTLLRLKTFLADTAGATKLFIDFTRKHQPRLKRLWDERAGVLSELPGEVVDTEIPFDYDGRLTAYRHEAEVVDGVGRHYIVLVDPEKKKRWRNQFYEELSLANKLQSELSKYRYKIHAKSFANMTDKLNEVNLARDLDSAKAIDRQSAFRHDMLKAVSDYFADAEPLVEEIENTRNEIRTLGSDLVAFLSRVDVNMDEAYSKWVALRNALNTLLPQLDDPVIREAARALIADGESSFPLLLAVDASVRAAQQKAQESRRPLDHKKFLDMLIDDMEDKYVELLEGTRAHTANIDNYIKRIATAVESDFNTQFYFPSFRAVREASRSWDVNLGQIETTGILANNRAFAKVSPQATMEFDLPKRDIVIAEAMNGAKAMVDDFGALVNDPSFLALAAMGSGQSPASQVGGAGGGFGSVRNVLPGLGTDMGEELLSQSGPGQAKLGAALESLIPDPAIYKFETGTGFEIRPVIQPDGQAVVFHFNYMYTTNVREPVRPDEKHLGRVKRHFIDTDVQLSNYELREVSRYQVALKASRTSRGVPLLEDVPLAGVLFRPLPQQESSLQENLILAQATIYPTLFDLMGLRW
ncbi:MAG: hypothetical protein ACYTG0_26155, partial [Planctomycetota bacterium]